MCRTNKEEDIKIGMKNTNDRKYVYEGKFVCWDVHRHTLFVVSGIIDGKVCVLCWI